MRLKVNDRPFAAVSPPVSASGAHQPVSYWHETVDVVPGGPLEQNLDCDVAIVGGGFTGLSTAYELKTTAPDLDVVLIERAVVGHGASGRNGGFAMPLIGWDLTHAVAALGRERGAQAYRLMYDAVDHTKRVIHQNNIDCDLEETGYLLLATCPAREKRIRNEVELAHSLGFDHQFLEGDALSEHIISDAFRCGSFDPAAAIINPAKLARGLKAVVENLGVAIYEQTPLVELDDATDPLVLHTPKATIRARAAVLGLNGYGSSVGFMPSRIHPVHTYIVLTEPVSDADLDTIGWSKKRASLETARNFIHYFRLTADNRILFGGEDVTLYMGGKYDDVHLPTFRALEARFRAYFPALNHVKFSHRWGGVLGVTLDMFPTFGQVDPRQKIFHATAYNGHGVSLSNYAGKIIVPPVLQALNHAAADKNPPAPFFYNRRPAAIPPDPLRYIGLQAYRAALHLQDKWQGA